MGATCTDSPRAAAVLRSSGSTASGPSPCHSSCDASTTASPAGRERRRPVAKDLEAQLIRLAPVVRRRHHEIDGARRQRLEQMAAAEVDVDAVEDGVEAREGERVVEEIGRRHARRAPPLRWRGCAAGADVGHAQLRRRRPRHHVEQRVGLRPHVLHVLAAAADVEHVEARAEPADAIRPTSASPSPCDEPDAGERAPERGVDAGHVQPRRHRREERVEPFGVAVGERAQGVLETARSSSPAR